MTCPFDENYTLPVSTKPIYENTPTGHVDACNECLLNPECVGDGSDSKKLCYKPCFGFEPITFDGADVGAEKTTTISISLNLAANKPEYTKDSTTVETLTVWNADEKDDWEYLIFLTDAGDGTVTPVTIVAEESASDVGDGKGTKLTIPDLTVTVATEATADVDSSKDFIFSLYRYRTTHPTDSGFDKLQDVYAPVFHKLKEIMDKNESANHLMKEYDDINFYNIRNNTPDEIAKTLFDSVKVIYNLNTSHVKTAYKDKESIQKELNVLQAGVADKKLVVDELKALNATSKRQIEINMYKSKKMRDTNKALMIVMIVVGCLVIFPILAKTNIASIGVFVGLWVVSLLIVLVYMFYELYYKKMGQDELVYAKYNFNKPSDKEVALSRAKATLSKSDKNRCQAFAELEEELELPNIDIDVSEYTSAVGPTGQCSNIN
jgi:hypothetical protein